MHNIKSYRNILVLFFCLIPLYASSQSTSNTEANLQVTATVRAACQISTEPLNFGNYDPLSLVDLYAQGAIIMNCVVKANPKIYLGSGISPKLDGMRQMLGPKGDLLAYKLFQPEIDATGTCTSRNKPWGNTSGDRLVTTPSVITGKTTYAVCGVIPKEQFVNEGAYSDTVVARFDFLP